MHSKEAAGCRLCRYRRVQEKRPDRDCLNGEVTVYLTLTFVLFVSLILALVESASVQMAKNYRRADMNRALECVFAEYQKELLEIMTYLPLNAVMRPGLTRNRIFWIVFLITVQIWK